MEALKFRLSSKSNSVFIATSLDGFIAKKIKIDWLHAVPNPYKSDMEYAEFTKGIDTLVT